MRPQFFENVWILTRKHEFRSKRPIGSYSAYTLTHYWKKISSKTSEKCRFSIYFLGGSNLCYSPITYTRSFQTYLVFYFKPNLKNSSCRLSGRPSCITIRMGFFVNRRFKKDMESLSLKNTSFLAENL